MERRNWTEEETIVAFYYYCQIPFGKIHKSNPEIIRIAHLINRSPSSIVLKMGNLAHFDPEQQKRKINGLSNASKLDEIVVKQFFGKWQDLICRAKEIISIFTNESDDKQTSEDIAGLAEEKERLLMIMECEDQEFFRNTVLSAYREQCCITGISMPILLNASHIKPLERCGIKTERIDPSNGLCLNSLHDKAFDQGLITVLPDYTIRVSSLLMHRKDAGDEGLKWLCACDRQKIHLPDKFCPAKEYLEYHNDVVFIS